jgi:hypothetical protein
VSEAREAGPTHLDVQKSIRLLTLPKIDDVDDTGVHKGARQAGDSECEKRRSNSILTAPVMTSRPRLSSPCVFRVTKWRHMHVESAAGIRNLATDSSQGKICLFAALVGSMSICLFVSTTTSYPPLSALMPRSLLHRPLSITFFFARSSR